MSTDAGGVGRGRESRQGHQGAGTASPLVETKLYVPRMRPALVHRPRLSEALARSANQKLTLISAPAGFGKTTLLAEWLAAASAGERLVGWLSLEASDRQPASFWTYLIAALQTAVPGLGASALPLVQSVQAPIEAVLASVLNELRAVPHDLDLVLDDYHLVDGPDIQVGMAFLLEHLPPRTHLVISTRADPGLPLARLRASGELLEIRAADLRFTLEEVAAYLNENTGLGLAVNDIAVLEERTEGWIAALQLAALSMKGRRDVAAFIAGFAGDDRYIVDYLVDEVLRRQPDEVRSFLVQTSILDRLSGPLCDAVTGQHVGRAMLESLERGNLFVIPLDDHRRWYRYHHLFADVLQTHLLADCPEGVVADLHRRASDWYEQNGESTPSIRHALAAGDVERAAGLVELAIPSLTRSRQEATIRGWLDAIPDEIVRVRPVLAMGFIGALMSGAEYDAVADRLDDVERWLEPTGEREGTEARPAGMVIVDVAEFPHLPGAIELYRTALALIAGDAPAVHRHAQLAIERAAKDDHVTRAGASALSGLASWGGGELEAGHRAYSICVEGLKRAGHIADVLGCSIALADIRTTQGRLSEALDTYEQALRLASGEAGHRLASGEAGHRLASGDVGPVLRGTADMHVGLSQIACERNDLSAANHHLQHASELGDHLGLPQNPYRWRVAMARVREAQGDLDAALELLEEAQRVYVGDFFPNVRPLPASRARVLVALGRLAEAGDWAREHRLSATDDLSYLHEFEHITLARILLARSRAERSEPFTRELAELLDRLLSAAEAGERTGSVIEVLVLQALNHHGRGNAPGALAALERALTLAQPEGYVRIFIGEGPSMEWLLRAVAKHRPGWDYVRRLLDAGGGAAETTRREQPLGGQRLVAPLSDRELEVLRLLASDLDGPQIARELTVSLNTLRTHTKNVYAKLGVNTRRAAVRHAVALNLLARTRDH